MRVLNVHSRKLACSAQRAGELIDSLASKDDLLWPRGRWPAMRFDRPLQVGAVGGHGPIRYTVEAYEPGKRVRFRFTGPKGFDGYHALELTAQDATRQVLTHRLEMDARGRGAAVWVLGIRSLHDALVEDALDRAELHATGVKVGRRWSLWVRLLRWYLGRGRAARSDTARDAT